MRQFFKGFPTNYATISSNCHPEPSTYLVLVKEDDKIKNIFQVDKEQGIETPDGWVKVDFLTLIDTPSTYLYNGKEISSDTLINHYIVTDMTNAILAIIDYNKSNSASQYFSHILSLDEFKPIIDLCEENVEIMAAVNDFMF